MSAKNIPETKKPEDKSDSLKKLDSKDLDKVSGGGGFPAPPKKT